jgi:hypothetical protein
VPVGANVDVNPLAPAGSKIVEVVDMDWGLPTIRVPGLVPFGGIVEVKPVASGSSAIIDVVEKGLGIPTWT